MGYKGVVVHCDKQCKMSAEEASENMLRNARIALNFATPICITKTTKKGKRTGKNKVARNIKKQETTTRRQTRIIKLTGLDAVLEA